MSVPAAALDDRLAAPGFVQDPYPVYERLRETAPAFRSEQWQCMVLTRYDDVAAAVKDTVRFSNADRFSKLLDQLPAELQDLIAPLRAHYASGILQCDPPDHGRIRGLVNRAFTPSAVRQAVPRIEALVDELLDAAIATGSFDLVADLARPLPAMVVAEMLGVPPEDRGMFGPLGDDLTGLQAAGSAVRPAAERAVAAVVGLEDYFGELYRARRAEPRDDLLTALLSAHEGDDRLTENELVNTCVTILVAGHETTRNLIGNAAITFHRHPGAWEELRSGRLRLERAVEEILRFESPIQRGWRRVAERCELHGEPMEVGDLLFLMLGAANRDPRRFADPETLDLDRADNPHLAFGWGPHFCLGAALARLEARIVLAALLRRFERLDPLSEPSFNPSIHMRGIASFDVDLRRVIPC
jgi:cytochrome P450